MPTKPKVVEAAGDAAEKGQSQMTELVRKLLLATIGAAAIAQEEIEALINRLVERGEIAEKDGKKLMHEMMDKRKSKTSKMEDEVSKNIEGVLNRMNIPSKADVEELGQKIAGLSKKIDELKKPSA
jgi:poly(hydroxyalkanoate) granule-associated protein